MNNNLIEDRAITNVFRDDKYIYIEELVHPKLLPRLMISCSDDADDDSKPDIFACNNNCKTIIGTSEINEIFTGPSTNTK